MKITIRLTTVTLFLVAAAGHATPTKERALSSMAESPAVTSPRQPDGPVRARFVPRELLRWVTDDARATVTGLRGNLQGFARLDVHAVLPRSDHHGGKNWPYDPIYDMEPITHLGAVFLGHDAQYEYDIPEGNMTRLQSDLMLMRSLWSLPLDQHPGPGGSVYRVLATGAFGLKSSLWTWWQ